MNTPASLYGESIFTTTRVKNGKMFFEEDHIQRLAKGIESYYLGRALSEVEAGELQSKIKALVPVSEKETRLRLSVSAPQRDELFRKNFVLDELVFSVQSGDLSTSEKPLRLKSFSSPFSQSYPDMKMGSYMPLLFLKMQAARAGYDDALLKDESGNLVEGTSSNLFFYKGNQLYAPSTHILGGVIKKQIEREFGVEKLEVSREVAARFDGAFLTNSASIIRPIQSVDQIIFKNLNENFVRDMLELILKRGYQ